MKNFDTDAEKKAFELGVLFHKEYIRFCMQNYPLELNIAGITKFTSDMVDHLNGKPYIPNLHGNLSFKDFFEKSDFVKK